MAITKMRLFRAETRSMTIVADDFDWGEPDARGRQYVSFFMKGNLIHTVPLDELCSIRDICLSEISEMKSSERIRYYAKYFGNPLPADRK